MIKDIKEEGKLSLPCLINRAEIGRTAKGSPYLSLTLEDSSGQLDAKFWNLTEEQAASYKAGQIVQAAGDLILYRSAWQLRVRSLTPIEGDVSEYVRHAPLSRKEIEEEVDALVAKMKNPIISQVTSGLLEIHRQEFFTYPAAVKNHHTYAGGIAYHSLSMARLAQAVLKQYPWLDYDLLIAGVLLHDMGKIEEYSSPVLPEYTPAGNLIGHISMMNTEIDRMAVMLEVQDSEEIMLLKHMVLSHHGRLEYGSPVMPMIPEAEVLSLLDNLDARMVMIREALDAVEPGHLGPRIFPLDNRMFYRRSTEQFGQEDQPAADPKEAAQ